MRRTILWLLLGSSNHAALHGGCGAARLAPFVLPLQPFQAQLLKTALPLRHRGALAPSEPVRSKFASSECRVLWTLDMKENSWARLLAYVTGLINQELLLKNQYLAAENRILRAHPASPPAAVRSGKVHTRRGW